MELLMHLWMPVLGSIVGVWLAATLGWMVLGHHTNDFKQLPAEDAGMDAIRQMKLSPGVYMFPFTRHKEASQPEMTAKWKRGPVGVLRMFGPVNMLANVLGSIAVYAVVTLLVAYLGASTLPKGAGFGKVFQVLGTAGVLGYGFAFIPGDIWFQNSKRATALCVVDGVVYGLLTGAIFAWLWPR